MAGMGEFLLLLSNNFQFFWQTEQFSNSEEKLIQIV
jgi:hypothetical protein